MYIMSIVVTVLQNTAKFDHSQHQTIEDPSITACCSKLDYPKLEILPRDVIEVRLCSFIFILQ
jgi:hypothetical protein